MTLEELKAEAERLYPYPLRHCIFARKKINYFRELWVAEQIKINPLQINVKG